MVGYLIASGLQTEPREIVNYYVALKSKPFVILVGSPEESRTMARLFAEALVGSPSPQFQSVSAHPWWASSTQNVGLFAQWHELFNALRFTQFVQMAEAVRSVSMPCFWGLFNMSPAEIECYFCDFARPIPQDAEQLYLSCFQGRRPIELPPNLYVTGTFNTQNGYCFSESVLKTATIIEWTAHSSGDTRHAEASDPPSSLYQRAFVHLAVREPEAVQERLRLALKDERRAAEPLDEISWLLWTHGIELSPAATELGQRYIANSFDMAGCGLFDPDPVRNLVIAQDYAIAQEVLPRIKEVLSRVRLIWWELAGYLVDRYPRATRWLLSRRPVLA
jgi:hypothetical protein